MIHRRWTCRALRKLPKSSRIAVNRVMRDQRIAFGPFGWIAGGGAYCGMARLLVRSVPEDWRCWRLRSGRLDLGGTRTAALASVTGTIGPRADVPGRCQLQYRPLGPSAAYQDYQIRSGIRLVPGQSGHTQSLKDRLKAASVAGRLGCRDAGNRGAGTDGKVAREPAPGLVEPA